MFKILVVEDDKDLNRSVCTFLKQNGYDAVGCPGANKAYDAMYDTVFDLIISDIMMPGVDGYEFAKTIRSLNSEIPILFMTARDDIGSMQKGYGIGIDDYMTKPVNFDELLLRIGALLRRAKIVNAENLPEQERKEYAVAISAAAIRLNTLITNVLRLSRLENQQIRPKSEQFDLGGQLTECLLGFENIWEEKEIEIEPDIEDDVIITSDRELLSIVWNNLLSNAFKFTEEGGTVSVSLRTEDKNAVVSVKDTGCGMPPETVRHVFDKFYQGDTSHSIQGNGLGLALVKRIVDIVGGEIRVESEPGEGSTFTVKLTGASKKN